MNGFITRHVNPRARRLSPRRLALACALAAGILAAGGKPGRAEDRVVLSTASGVGSVILKGRVVNWTGQTLTLAVANDRLRKLEAGRVRRVETVRLATHQAGSRALAKGKYDKAVAKLSQALTDEPRTWMRREILAELVRANLGQGDRLAAAKHFLAIHASDPTTFWFDRIPLAWRFEKLDFEGLAPAARWLDSSENAVARLVGASLLLFHPVHGERAADVLEALAASPNDRIFQLARAQRWRAALRDDAVSELTVTRWTDRMRQFPQPLRAGPRYLIGHAHARLGHPHLAATNWMWLPLVHDQNPTLAAKAEVLAAEQLMQTGKGAAAIVLYREVIERFGNTPSGTIAEDALAKLQKSDPHPQTSSASSGSGSAAE